MIELMPWIWLAVFIVLVVVEILTTEFVSLWFALAAFPALMFSAFFPENIWLQVITFFLVGFGLMFISRPIIMKYFRKNTVNTNVDSYIGKTAVVIKEISEEKRGAVYFESLEWTAISADKVLIGEKVRILAIEGNKFIVTKIDK